MGPSLDQFLEAARPHNEGVSDDALKSYWQENYGGTAPAPTRAASLPSLTRFLAEAKKANPDVPEDDLKAYWSNEYGARGAQEKDSTEWDVTRGLKVAFKQLPQLGYGLSTFAAATLESALGEGGLATAAKNWALAGYKKWGEKIEQDSKENDDFNTAYDKAKAGDLGALVDWAAYGIGYSAGQAAQILGTGGLGALAGRAVLKPATEKFVGGLVAKEVERITAANAGKAVAAEAIQKEAVGNVASQLGQWGTIGANAFGMEGGEIGGDLVQDHEGRALSGAEIARAMGATALAGGLEFAGDALGFGALTGKLTRGGAVGAMTGVGGRVARAGLAGIETGAGEAATEYGQTLAEEYGKGREDTLVPWDVNDATRRDALNSAALGAIGGHAHGIVGGALAAPRKDPVQEIIKATDVDTAVKAAIDAVHVSDVTLDSEVTGLVGRESAASRNTREEVAASEQAVRDSAFDQRDAHIAHLEAQSRELTEREKAQLEVAYASRNAEIARLIQPIAQAQAAPLIERAAGADTAVGQALAQARLPGESQQAYQARLEAQDAGKAARATGEPEKPGAAAQQGTVSRGTPAEVKVFGRPVGALTDNALRVAATNHRMSAFREAALTEIERRKAATTTTTSRERIEGAPDVAEAGGTRLRSAAEGAQTLSNQMGEEFTPVASRSEVPITARLTANAVTKAFGKEVVFVTGGKNASEGAMLPDDPSKIYVNVNASRKWQAVIAHETVHALKRTNAKVYAELRRAVNAALTDKAFEDIDAKYYELQDRPDIQNEELIANVAADQAHEPKFWLEVFKHTKDARALARALFSAIDKLASKLTGNGRPGYNTKEFITDHKAVRSAVAKAYAQWEKGAKEGGGTNETKALLSKPDFAKFVSKLPRTDEGEIAGSGGKSVRDVWNLVQRMERLAREGKPHAGWYKESATEILKAFKGDKRAAEIFIQLIAITSANREVKSNFTLAEKALVQFAGGEPINVGTGQMNDKINDLLYFGIPWEGRKTNNFYRNIGQQIGLPGSKETTQDMHMGVLGLGKKQLSDAEYSFMDKVTKFVASRLKMSPVETQAAIWVPQKARHTMRRYMEKGFHRGMSAQALRRMALADAAINYGTLVQKRWSMLGPEVSGFPSARETRAQGAQITAEVKPSTKLEIGQALVKLSMARLQEYQKAAFARVFKGAGPDVLMRAFDLDRTQYRIVEGAGGYDATMAPNAIVTMNTDAETTERVAKAWMYIFKQDAVPFFRTDDKLRDDPKAAQAVKIRFAESLTNTQLREVYDRLRAQVDPAIGLTKLDHNVIAIVNFRDENGSPFVMPDEQFVEKIAEAVKANDLGAKINGYGRFGAETSYPYHDWSEDREGAGLLAAAAGGRPDLQARLRRWGNLFGQFAEGRARAAQRAAGVAERQREPVALQSKRDQAAGESHANPIATASAAVAYDRENPLKESRLGRCHELVFAKAVRDGLTHVFGVVNGFPSAPQPRAPIKIWHSLGLDPKSGNIWEPISNRWYTRAAMKAFGFEPVVSLSAAESLKLAVKTRLIPDQSVYDEHVKPLRGADKEYLEPGDYTPNWKALGKDALQSKPDLDFTEPPEEAVLGEQESDRLMELREAAIARPRRSPRVEWASRPRAGNWLSSTGEGRYSIEPEGRGFWAVSNGEQVSFENSRTDAIAVLNDRYLEDIAEGEVPDPQREKTITKQYLPSQVERVVAGMKRLAEVPGMFRLAVSEKKPLKDIFRDVDTEKLVSNVVPQGGDETGVSYAITFTNNKIAFVNEDFQNKTAYVDASHFDKGSQMGSFAYPAILNWAHNNGIKLVPDPAGLSAVNTYRRTEQMLSAALKFGSTEFMSPHPDQGLFGWNDNPENQRDNDQNIAILLLTSMNNTFSKVPAAENIHYDFEARRFEDSDNEPVDAQDFTAIARETQPRQWGIGRTTLARAIFIHSLLNQEGPARAKQVKDFLDLSKPVKNLLADQPEDERLLALYSKPAYIGADAVANSAARKAGLYRPEKTMRERVKEMMPTLGKRMRQGLVDQFAPIKEVSYEAYMRARMSKGSDGALEAMFLYGKPVLEDGALNVKMGDGGLTEILQRLGGEHDRFIAWIAGNRAAQLKSEGRERLFEDDEIAWLKDLNKGEMPNGKSRAALYAEVHKEFNAYSKAVLDIAEEQGLIDAESRAVWEKDFYVPFYRNMDAQVSGPTVKSGLVSQQAFKKLKGGKEELNDLLANTLTNWSHLLSAAMKNKAALVTLEAAVTNGAAIEVPSDHIGKQMQVGKVLKALDGGAERYFMVEDPFLVDAISSLESFSFGPVGKLFETVKRWLTIGVTANPAFKIRNLIRDSISSVGVSELPYNPLANVTKAWADTAHSSQLRASLLASGGIIRFGTQLEGSRAEYVRDLIDEGVDADTILDKEHKVVSMLKLAWDRYQEFGDRGENVNRVALYKQLRSEGKSHLEASFAARDLMDFSMQGTWRAIRFLTQTVPFFNARLQGLYKGGRAAVENPQRMGYVMGGVAFASMALLLAYKDDDDWKKREEWDRDNFWWFKVGDKAFRIPKPFEIGALGTMAERALEYIVSDEMTGKRFANRMLAVVSDNLSMNPVPQIAKPLIELYANKDFFRGRPIETQGMENLSPSERIGRGTSAAAQLAGKANVLSPVQIDHVIRAYFGWLGTSATTILDYGLRPAMGLAEKPESTLKDAFLVGNFVESLPTNTSRYVTDFYDSSKVVEQAYADWRHALQTRQPERAKELREEGKDQIALHGYVTATNKQLAAYNKLEKMIEADKTMSAEQKRARLDRIDTLKNEAAKRYADLVGKRRAAEAALAK